MSTTLMPRTSPEPAIELSDGTIFPIFSGATFTPETIAHGLALECRFGKQASTFYCVAQHSILVCQLMKAMGGDPFEGLLHDGAEFVMGDLATPIKYSCLDYNDLEKDIQRRINRFFGLPQDKSMYCHRADKIAMFMEAYNLVPSRGTTFDDPLGVRELAISMIPDYEFWLIPMPFAVCKSAWLTRYYELLEERA